MMRNRIKEDRFRMFLCFVAVTINSKNSVSLLIENDQQHAFNSSNVSKEKSQKWRQVFERKKKCLLKIVLEFL